MATFTTSVAFALICVVGLNAIRFPDEEILERLYNLRRQPSFDEDPRYQLLGNEEEEHPMVLDDILPYFSEVDENGEPVDDYYNRDEGNNIQVRDGDDTPYEIRSNDPRDPERAQGSALWGTHYVSGGAGEGKQVLKPNGEEKNKQEVKSDNALPAYCEPPNPCPKGYTESDNCVEGVNDTPTFNRKYIIAQQESRYCACDSEHMKQCPNDKPKINTKGDDTEGEIMAALDKQNLEEEKKRHGLFNRVAKKMPHLRFRRSAENDNPYQKGPKLPIAAKKLAADDWDRWAKFNQMMREDESE